MLIKFRKPTASIRPGVPAAITLGQVVDWPDDEEAEALIDAGTADETTDPVGVYRRR